MANPSDILISLSQFLFEYPILIIGILIFWIVYSTIDTFLTIPKDEHIDYTQMKQINGIKGQQFMRNPYSPTFVKVN